MAWDRYAYVKYNPIKYVDPSGKFFTPPSSNIRMTDGGNSPDFFEDRYNISFNSGGNGASLPKSQEVAIKIAVMKVGEALGAALNMGSAAAFSMVFGGLDFSYGTVSGGYGWAYGDHQILFDDMYSDLSQAVKLIIHEIGHIFDRAVCAANNGGVCTNVFGSGTARDDLLGRLGVSSAGGLNNLGRQGYYDPNEIGFYGFAGGKNDWQFGAVWSGDGGQMLHGEIWADMFVGWVYNSWETDETGQLTASGMSRSIYMKGAMRQYMQLLSGGN